MERITQSLQETDKKPAAKAKPQMGRASERPLKGAAQQVEHSHQSNASLSAYVSFPSNVSYSQGSSSFEHRPQNTIKITQSLEEETDKKPAAKAKLLMGCAPENPLQAVQQMEHRHQNNASPFPEDLHGDVSYSQGSFDGSVILNHKSYSSLSDWTSHCPSPSSLSDCSSQILFAAPLSPNCANDVGFSWQTDGSYDAMQGCDDRVEKLVAQFLRIHAKPIAVSEPDFAGW